MPMEECSENTQWWCANDHFASSTPPYTSSEPHWMPPSAPHNTAAAQTDAQGTSFDLFQSDGELRTLASEDYTLPQNETRHFGGTDRLGSRKSIDTRTHSNSVTEQILWSRHEYEGDHRSAAGPGPGDMMADAAPELQSALHFRSPGGRNIKHTAFRNMFHTSAAARDFRRSATRFMRRPYRSPDSDHTIEEIRQHHSFYVEQIYNAMVRADAAKDNENSIAMRRWVLGANYPSELVEAYAHKVFDCLLEQAEYGFRGFQHNDYAQDVRKSEEEDRDVDCLGRLNAVIKGLEEEKTICEDVMNSACQIRMFVNAPRAYAQRKVANRQGNSKRGRGGKRTVAEQDEQPASRRVRMRTSATRQTLGQSTLATSHQPATPSMQDTDFGSPAPQSYLHSSSMSPPYFRQTAYVSPEVTPERSSNPVMHSTPTRHSHNIGLLSPSQVHRLKNIPQHPQAASYGDISKPSALQPPFSHPSYQPMSKRIPTSHPSISAPVSEAVIDPALSEEFELGEYLSLTPLTPEPDDKLGPTDHDGLPPAMDFGISPPSCDNSTGSMADLDAFQEVWNSYPGVQQFPRPS